VDVIILGDFNAKSSLWHCPVTDQHGEIFEDLIEQLSLTVVNREGQPTTFKGQGPSGNKYSRNNDKGEYM